jgi:large subunit ribosomal protein L11
MPDLNAYDIEAAMKSIEGTARNMGVAVKGVNDAELAEQQKEAAAAEIEAAKREAELEEMEAEVKEEHSAEVEVINEKSEEEKTEE